MENKKLIKTRNYNIGIVESYKATDKAHEQSCGSIIGSFSVKGMTVENAISQNRTKYTPEVWAQPTAFGRGGKFIDENGKLRPATLFGSVDHPTDDHAELLLNEAAIAWYNVTRNDDGSWDGDADILDNPQGKIVKTFLEYAKFRGGGHLLGVSSRALGESVLSESSDGQYESIIADSFELMSFDFVYNPSFQTAVASLNESKKGPKKSLVESVKALAKEDEEHADVYNKVAEELEKEVQLVAKKKFEGKSVEKAKADYLNQLKEQEHELHNAIYEIEKMTDEEFEKAYEGNRAAITDAIKAEYREVLEELNNLKNAGSQPATPGVKAENVISEENKTIKDFADEAKAKEMEVLTGAGEGEGDIELEGEDEEDQAEGEEDSTEGEDNEEDSAEGKENEEEEESEMQLLKTIKSLMEEILTYVKPIEDPDLTLGEEEDLTGEGEEDLEDLTGEEGESTEDDKALAAELDLSEEDLEAMTDEELEYALAMVEEGKD